MPRTLVVLAVLMLTALASAQDYALEAPAVVHTGAPFDVVATRTGGPLDAVAATGLSLHINGEVVPHQFSDGALRVTGFVLDSSGTVSAQLLRDGKADGVSEASAVINAIPAWMSMLPPLLAILSALLFRRVVPALFLGIWVGSWTALGWAGVGMGLLDAFAVYVKGSLVNSDHISIILFTFMIGGMVGIISRSGGTQGIVAHIVRWATTPRRGQLSTATLGLVIFFDDYANTLVVGNTMRPVTDRLAISRAKLAYIVDSTAAPVACVAFVTTWIGYEVGIIGEAVKGLDGYDEAAYSIFLNSIPYSFYPILAIFFVFAVAFSRRDFGAMHAAELAARTGGSGATGDTDREPVDDGAELAPKAGAPARAVNALLPVVVLTAGVLIGLVVTGYDAALKTAEVTGEPSLREIIGKADSYLSLLWASLVAVLVAGAMALTQRILDLEEVVEAWYSGVRAMLFAMIILVLAWALADITKVLHTADYLVAILGDALPVGLVPALIFLISAATAFATGSSWGTMGILMPLVIPLAWAVLGTNGVADPSHYHVIYSSVACVLAGSVWGDHCSPISDTTILSSMASGCDHIEHVRTQLPYAMTVGLVALLLCTVPSGFGLPWFVCIPASLALLWTALRWFGKPTDAAAA